MPDASFRPGLELMTYLDGNLSSNGLDDPALSIQFHLPWWHNQKSPTGNTSYLCSATITSALDHFYRQQRANALLPVEAYNLADELNKPAYTWHSSVNDELPNTPNNNCTRCRLYRAVAVGVLDQLRDTYNMVHACEVANGAEKDIAIRRASGFNELFGAALNKECDEGQEELRSGSGSGLGSAQAGSGARSKGKGKAKQQFGPEVQELKKVMKNLINESGEMASRKWTWGVDLTDEDLHGLIRGADRHHQVPHSGYDEDLPSHSLQSQTSDALDPANLEDPTDQDLRFDELSTPIYVIPELRPHEIATYSLVLLGTSGEETAGSEPDSVIEAFAKRAKTQATRANKLLMQHEADQPVSFLDYGSEFIPKIALVPRRPWLAPRLPTILPPTNVPRAETDHTMDTESDTDDEYPDHIDINSDDIPDHVVLPDSDSGPSSQVNFPVSDEELSDPMDVDMQMVDTDSDSDSSIPDHIVLSDPSGSPIGRSEATGAFGRDANTGRFTAASFANFTDDVLD